SIGDHPWPTHANPVFRVSPNPVKKPVSIRILLTRILVNRQRDGPYTVRRTPQLGQGFSSSAPTGRQHFPTRAVCNFVFFLKEKLITCISGVLVGFLPRWQVLVSTGLRYENVPHNSSCRSSANQSFRLVTCL